MEADAFKYDHIPNKVMYMGCETAHINTEAAAITLTLYRCSTRMQSKSICSAEHQF